MGKKNKKQKKAKNSSNGKLEKKLRKLEEEIQSARRKMIKLHSKQARMDVQDYVFKDKNGNDVKLSETFGDKENLVLIHNMGKFCSYCTLWADGFNGVTYFVETKAAFALVSPDPPDVQKQFAEERGWKFNMYSAYDSTFISDMGYKTETGSYWPGVSVFHKDGDGNITRVAKDYFGPGDFYSSPWHFFDLLPKNGKVESED
ncbi:MAG: DUF899 family protein [Chlorobi bacterium]|nr:DUF899 family protein [Chlorobiota bacterium]MCI0714829.1 DUF899 family protein [Chlorobiota bacterium]